LEGVTKQTKIGGAYIVSKFPVGIAVIAVPGTLYRRCNYGTAKAITQTKKHDSSLLKHH